MPAQELVDRMKNAMKHKIPAETVDRSAELIPGMRYRNERGGMVTILRSLQHRVTYQRDDYSGVCELSRYQFDLKFKKVQS
ncbi:DUF4222 domain-containing protein [Citrobacter portucalensis]|uniref:DUF4222 domain-containing protein n=1 Tax=Citrobacter portucalensis TaxID=1639133 RepID=UPI00226BA511|nr:DUF4222 domain-containing protein [Citrobacter portucalensis]MCX8984824.1 DUF4222 domain-containing protein [Citrobacter portucalensis]